MSLQKFVHGLRAATPDMMLVVGAGSASYGAWLLAPAFGFILGGVCLLIGGIFAGRAGGEDGGD